MNRPYTAAQKALLDEMSRSTDPSAEALMQLEHELASSDVARKAFGAELVRMRKVLAIARHNKARLPKAVREALEQLPRSKNYDMLVAAAEARGEPQPYEKLLVI